MELLPCTGRQITVTQKCTARAVRAHLCVMGVFMLSVNERGDGQVDSNNPNGNGSSPTQLVDRTVQMEVGKPGPLIRRSRSKRARAAISTPVPTVSLVIPVRNEARNIAWVLEQIADDVDEIILVDGDSTDATLITARSYRPDIRVVPQEGIGKGSALRTGFLGRDRRHHRDDGRRWQHGARGNPPLPALPCQRI